MWKECGGLVNRLVFFVIALGAESEKKLQTAKADYSDKKSRLTSILNFEFSEKNVDKTKVKGWVFLFFVSSLTRLMKTKTNNNKSLVAQITKLTAAAPEKFAQALDVVAGGKLFQVVVQVRFFCFPPRMSLTKEHRMCLPARRSSRRGG